jgi:hypothetical protein
MEYQMKRIALAAVGAAAAVGLTACSHPAAPAAVPASPTVRHTLASCHQQYATWRQGPGKGILAALHTVSVASSAGDAHVLTVTLEKARPTVARATRHPVPACADPRGYWSVLLMHLTAAAASSSSAADARAAMKNVPQIERKLTAEVKGTSE